MSKRLFYISEIYPCIQGEGHSIGKPSILVRFQVCNLHCRWCDTAYTQTPTSDPVDILDLDKGFRTQEMSLESIVDNIKTYKVIKHIMFTGGEPTLQNFHYIFRGLGDGYTVEVESNATIIPHEVHTNFNLDDYKSYQWNLSPKGANAGQVINERAMQFWSELSSTHDKVFFKFVICKERAEENLKEVLHMVERYTIPTERIYLMPEGTTLESQLNNHWLVDLCLQYNFNYTPRLHIILFNNKRGV